jgi:hypothetical protein
MVAYAAVALMPGQTGTTLRSTAAPDEDDIQRSWYEEACLWFNFLVHERISGLPPLPEDRFTSWSKIK